MRNQIQVNVYRNQEFIGHFATIRDASKSCGDSQTLIANYMRNKKVTRRGYFYTQETLTKEQLKEIMPMSNEHSDDIQRGDFFLEKSSEGRKAQLETYICTHLQSYWSRLPKQLAKAHRKFIKALLESI